jgi:hypothetical protein
MWDGIQVYSSFHTQKRTGVQGSSDEHFDPTWPREGMKNWGAKYGYPDLSVCFAHTGLVIRWTGRYRSDYNNRSSNVTSFLFEITFSLMILMYSCVKRECGGGHLVSMFPSINHLWWIVTQLVRFLWARMWCVQQVWCHGRRRMTSGWCWSVRSDRALPDRQVGDIG